MGTAGVITKRFATLQEASRYSGVSERTIRRWLERQLLKPYRPGGLNRTLVDLRALDEVILGSGPEADEGTA
jgi:excisionase family DNA binding protein